MNMNLHLFAGLPLEIIKLFISYDGRLKYRNGKWMNQIDKNDKRLLLYDTIPKPYLSKDLPVRHKGGFHISINFAKKKRFKQLYIYNHWEQVYQDDSELLSYKDRVYNELNYFYNSSSLIVKEKETIRYLFRRFGNYREPDDLWDRE